MQLIQTHGVEKLQRVGIVGQGSGIVLSLVDVYHHG
jgi:hypothetical protein